MDADLSEVIRTAVENALPKWEAEKAENDAALKKQDEDALKALDELRQQVAGVFDTLILDTSIRELGAQWASSQLPKWTTKKDLLEQSNKDAGDKLVSDKLIVLAKVPTSWLILKDR